MGRCCMMPDDFPILLTGEVSVVPTSWLLLRTPDGWQATAYAAPPVLVLTDPAGRGVWELLALRWRDAAGAWHPLPTVRLWEGSDGERRLLFSRDATTLSCLSLRIAADGLAFRLQVSALEGCAAEWLALDLRARPDEHFLGLGERFDRLDQRGAIVDLTVVNAASGGRTYAPIPFYLSSAGYGLQLLSDAQTVLHLATADDPAVVSIRCAAPTLALRLIPGKSPKEILSRYTAFAGRPALPPAWVFGPWKSRDWTTDDQGKATEDIIRGRAERLAGTVRLIDASWQPYYQSLTFDPARFPDPAGMIRQAHSQGYRILLWIAPWLVWSDPPSETYRYCAERGYLIKTRAGAPYVHRLANSPTFVGSCLDFTHPGAAAWWQEQIRRLVRLGVSGFKTDFGEQIPDDAVFADGRTGREVHNIYPRLYQEATYAALRAAPASFDCIRQTPPDSAQDASTGILSTDVHAGRDATASAGENQDGWNRGFSRFVGHSQKPAEASSPVCGILLSRAAWDGSQAVTALWAGDQSSDFGPATGLPSAIIAGLSAGLSGFPFWASDIGGYFGAPTDEVFIRWAQFGALSPIMQLHGLGKREPWTFEPETLAIYRRYARLHTDLLPYILTFARHAVEKGLPIMRALALEFPDDAGVWGDMAEHEYCFGDALLVAPVYWGGDRFRYTYLPGGAWRDFWTGAALTGGRIHRLPAPLETLPLVARAGALIPLLDPSADTCLPCDNPTLRVAGDDLRLLIFGGADGRFELYDGTRFAWDDAAATLTVEGSAVARQVAAHLVGSQMGLVHACGPDDRPIAWEQASLNGETGFVRVNVGPTGRYRIVWRTTD